MCGTVSRTKLNEALVLLHTKIVALSTHIYFPFSLDEIMRGLKKGKEVTKSADRLFAVAVT